MLYYPLFVYKPPLLPNSPECRTLTVKHRGGPPLPGGSAEARPPLCPTSHGATEVLARPSWVPGTQCDSSF